MKKVFVALSGGVDSSVAAALLKERNFDVIGIHLKCFNADGCAVHDAEDARRAAEHLGIPFYVFDFEKEYKKKVVEYMIDGYKKGITPNPDVMCNKEIKFGLFYKKAMELGADFIATGHYIRLIKNRLSSTRSGRSSGDPRLSSRRRGSDGASRQIVSEPPSPPAAGVSAKPIFSLATARDRNKDQSYFLWTLKPEQLERCLFPIGDYVKPRVRKLAARFGLHNALKKDSQGICFLGQVSLPDFLKKYIKPKKGPIVIANSSVIARSAFSRERMRGGTKQSYKIIGEHNGAHFYTIGQRHLGIKNYELGIKNKPDQKPFYVASKDIKKNIIVVAEGKDNSALYKNEIELTDVNLFNVIASEAKQSHRSIPVLARVRYRQPLARAKLYIPNSRELGNRITATLIFDKSQKFVAEGQSAVFYNSKGVMLGGGIIKSAV